MRAHARAVVIGGGVVGVSTLYHLAKKGWSDSVLIERKELTSGSTWHAAGLLPLFNLSYSVGQIHKYSVALYQTLETRDRARPGSSSGVEHSTRAHARPDGRIQLLRRRRGNDRRQGEVPQAGRGQDNLAALRCRWNHRRHPAPRGRLHPARRSHASVGARRARSRRRDQPPYDGQRHRAAAERRMEGLDRQGRGDLRACRFGDRQFRAGKPGAWSESTFQSYRSSTNIS